jgi:hypothetical protein
MVRFTDNAALVDTPELKTRTMTGKWVLIFAVAACVTPHRVIAVDTTTTTTTQSPVILFQ